MVGRVLDFLRLRAEAGPDRHRRCVAGRDAVGRGGAVRGRRAGADGQGTQHTYRTWNRRLVAEPRRARPRRHHRRGLHRPHRQARPRRAPQSTSADARAARPRRTPLPRPAPVGLPGREGLRERQRRALRLRKPARAEPHRRGVTVEEAALLRELARRGRDPLLDEVISPSPSGSDCAGSSCAGCGCATSTSSGPRSRCGARATSTAPCRCPPGSSGCSGRYVEDRRPAGVSAGSGTAATRTLPRHPPTTAPAGGAGGAAADRGRVRPVPPHAPDLFARRDLSLHSYRHALGTFIDARYGRAVPAPCSATPPGAPPPTTTCTSRWSRSPRCSKAYEAHLLGDGDSPDDGPAAAWPVDGR